MFVKVVNNRSFSCLFRVALLVAAATHSPLGGAVVLVDPTFGFIETNIAQRDNLEDNDARSVVRQTDGKLVTAGYADIGTSSNTEGHFLVQRFNTDGSTDTAFGDNGSVIAPQIDPSHISSFGEVANKVIQLASGKLLAVGATYGTDSHFALVRYNTDGSLDTSFDTDGIVMTDVSNSGILYDVVEQADNKLLVVGSAGVYTSGSTLYGNIAIARYNLDGSLDGTFGTGGITTTTVGTYAYGTVLFLLGSGDVLVVGGSDSDTVILRYTSTGTLDTIFGTSGKVLTGLDIYPSSAIQQADGNLVVTGTTGSGDSADILVARFLPTGAADNGFDTDGKMTIDFGSASGYDDAKGVFQQLDGNLLVTGRTRDTGSTDQMTGVARLTTAGALDQLQFQRQSGHRGGHRSALQRRQT